MSRTIIRCLVVAFAISASLQAIHAADIHRAQGEMTGEVSSTTAIVQTRLTAVDKNVDGDVQGAAGTVSFEYSTSKDFAKSVKTPGQEATADSDYIVKTVLRDLVPGTRYFYRVHFGPDAKNTKVGETCSFRTLAGKTGTKPVSFVVVTGMNYSKYHGGKRKFKGPNPERVSGFPSVQTMLSMDLDFFVGTGDNVYYDGKDFFAKEQVDLRRKWHEQFVQQRFVKLFRNLPTYWEKDDHDHRYNDCDQAGNKLPSSVLGIATFREQMPVVDLNDRNARTYRTFRVNRDLQIWLVEGRDYRSPNKMDDGPDKTLWGAEQIKWLKQTLLASDATFKLLISPTPMVGPDDGYKIDNHVNHKGFRTEGRAFFKWIIDNKLHQRGFYTLCGDRHWQYHSKDPMGVEEFSCGALVNENARLGRSPGDPKSTDPNAEVHQFYTQKKASGGFLRVTVGPDKDKANGSAVFTFVNDGGKVLYETTKTRPIGK
jgi:alkaline phosphatase D